ncbi:cysteinyl-tRNA synthetase, putative [Eimeria maxima]|uniref:Cysteinyl-tRNA synthetase, putative n=1 Tax=Eimeria maxima TaxID=5804 RepID=U6LWU9_EIMMA|nr:cysteinyl-tRNA synthetase, putative [Eimeria maxima]CDJ56206.1 cysteinyl-tRNA synthetase, putative [Eimeria maxima]
MEPGSVADQDRVLEGEGALGVVSSEKKHPCDFALWKKAKQDEPSWPSKWGPGRPGWHIECSAMASSLLPFPLDIHSGGIDLRFPHHDNELAQTEAAKDKPQWVNYFLHSGHLHIYGSKMSKSLKNFVTIKECLQVYKPRHIRFLCLMNRWDAPMNYSPDGETLQQAKEIDNFFINFFSLCRLIIRKNISISNTEQRWRQQEISLHQLLADTKNKVREYLLDNFDTPEALVRRVCTAQLRHNKSSSKREDSVSPSSSSAAAAAANKQQQEEQQQQGEQQEEESNNKSLNELLGLCDELRDKVLPSLGVLLQDRPDGTFTYRLSTKEDVMKEMQLKKEEEQRKEMQKQEEKQKLAELEEKRRKEGLIKPQDYFKILHADTYGQFNDDGFPLTFKDDVREAH